MSYLRNGETRTYFDGESNCYVYTSGGTHDWDEEPGDELQREGGQIQGDTQFMTEADLAEIALRMIARTEVSDETLANVEQAMTEYYPRTIRKQLSVPELADAIDGDSSAITEDDAIDQMRAFFPEDALTENRMKMAYQLWQSDK